MEWKKKFEEKIKEEDFINSFKTNKDVFDYLEKYFKEFFDVQVASEILKVTRTLGDKSGAVKIDVLGNRLEVIEAGEAIGFTYMKNNGSPKALGMLFRKEDMRLYINETQKEITFNKEALDRFMEITFNPDVILKD